MENDKDSQSPVQNNNQPAAIGDTSAYNQYIDPNYQNNKKRKKILILLIIAVFSIIAIVVFAIATSSSSDQSNNEDETVSTAEVCEDESCFEEYFKLCQPAKFESLEPEGNTVNYEISGTQDVGCIVALEFIDSEDMGIVGKAMTCDFDNELGFREALHSVHTYPTDYSCEGSLVEYYNEAIDSYTPLSEQ